VINGISPGVPAGKVNFLEEEFSVFRFYKEEEKERTGGE